MKDFFKYTLATILGIVIVGLVMLLIFAISFVGVVAADSATTQVKDNSVFVLSMNGVVQERCDEDTPLSLLLGQLDMSAMGLEDILNSIRKAKENDDIKGIYIEGGATEFDSPATAQQIRDALKDFKQSGKWVVAFADQYLQASYYVASVADKVYLNKTGLIDFKGLGGKSQYLKGLYDKIGVRYQAARVGKYKSYVESVTRKDMSDDDREQRTAMVGGIWNHWLKDMADSRQVTAEQLNQLANDSIIMLADANDYLKAKLVDQLMYPEEIKAEIKARLNVDDDDDIHQLTLADMKNVAEKTREKGEEIAVYYAYGEIIDQSTGLFEQQHNIVGTETVKDLTKLADDDDVKAVVMRVNSGGGSANASEQIWHAIKLLKAKKPVVVSMGGAAASGGYMISAAANHIVAEPTTITGSIGIFGLIPNYGELVTDKLGVTFDGVKTNRFTDFEHNLILGKDNQTEISYLQKYVDRGYLKFLDIVAEGRNMTRDQVNEIAQGRVWIGSDALPIKLVDQLGSLNDAIKKAAELAKLEEYHTKAYPEAPSLLQQLLDMSEEKGSYLDAEMRRMLGDLYNPILDMRRDTERNRLQARFPYSISVK